VLHAYEEQFKGLGLFNLEKRIHKRNLEAVFQCLEDSHRENGGTPFTRMHGNPTRGNRHKSLQGNSAWIQVKSALLEEKINAVTDGLEQQWNLCLTGIINDLA